MSCPAVPPSAIMSPGRPSLRRILSDTSLIINANSGHFLALSILFIFPASFTDHMHNLLSNPSPLEIPDVGNSQIHYELLVSLISHFFSICAASSITASTFNGFYGRPIEFIPTLRSVLASFLPLLATTLLIESIIPLISLAFLVLAVLANHGLAWIGLDMNYFKNEYLLVVSIAFVVVIVVMAAVILYLQIEWSLSNAVVVVESNRGFSALRRSAYLVKGARGVMLSFWLFFEIYRKIFLEFALIAAGVSDGWNVWLIVKIIVFAGFSTFWLLYSLAGSTVFFIYCKALGPEFESEFDGGEYFPLPHGVYVV